MRPCGCDTDVRVFGHVTCHPDSRIYGKHLTCACTTCTCGCHKRDH